MNSKELCLSILDKAGVPINSSETWSFQVHNEKVWDRIISQHQLGLGEAYMDGWWDCEQLDIALTKLLSIDAVSFLKPSLSLAFNAIKSNLLNMQTKSRAAQNAKHHYNIGNDLYTRMLDRELAYSCGYWASAQTLDQAQEDKFDLICRKLKLEPGMKLLDIGSGWGGLLRFAVKNYKVIATGISPADEQIKLAREKSEGLNINFIQQDYRDLVGKFDRIVSVGMMEHVGPKNYRTYFEKCDELLTDDGISLLHTISGNESRAATDPFFNRYIFPGGVIPSLPQLTKAFENLFVLEDLHNFGLDYDRTLMHWHKNINSKWHEIPQYDERFQRMWNFYLLGSAAGFRSRQLQLTQFVLRKNGPLDRYVSVR